MNPKLTEVRCEVSRGKNTEDSLARTVVDTSISSQPPVVK